MPIAIQKSLGIKDVCVIDTNKEKDYEIAKKLGYFYCFNPLKNKDLDNIKKLYLKALTAA